MPKKYTCPSCKKSIGSDALHCSHCGSAIQNSHASFDLENELREAIAPGLVLIRQIGKGGMGSVFLARDPALKRLVAIKVLASKYSEDPTAKARFEREAQAVAGLSHPNIVSIYAVGELTNGTPFFVMQHVGGQSIADRLREHGPVDSSSAGKILGEVASALAAAHRNNIIHRDIKPANILYDDETGWAIVCDFGIAAVKPKDAAPSDTRLTETGSIIGTPHYMSPEQLLAEDVTVQTDMYALGVLGYELLAGRGPFEGSPQQLIAAHLRDTPPDLTDFAANVDPEVEWVIKACLDKDPGKRPTSSQVEARLSSSPNAILEWPPPGLAEIHGQLNGVNLTLFAGAIAFCFSFIVVLTAGQSLPLATRSFPVVALGLAGAAGVVLTFFGVIRFLKTLHDALVAVREGYGWTTIFETTADERKDTGNVIAGLKEYSTLNEDKRNDLRKGRLKAATAGLLTGLLPMPLTIFSLWLGARGWIGVRTVPYLVLAPPSICFLFWAYHLNRERKTVGKIRKVIARQWHSPERFRGLVKPWYDTLKAVAGNQTVFAGPTGHASIGRWTAYLTVGVIGVTIWLFFPIITVSWIGPEVWRNTLAVFPNGQERLGAIMMFDSYRAPVDSSITPLAAGQALWSLHKRDHDPAIYPEYVRPALTRYDADMIQPIPEAAFLNARRDDFEFLDPEAVLAQALNGFTTTEIEYLRELTGWPVWQEFGLVAHAGPIDIVGAMFEPPFPEEMNLREFYFASWTKIRDLAYANASRAALSLAEGRHAEAEAFIKETISVGLQFVTNASVGIDGLYGLFLTRMGTLQLSKFYELTENPRYADLRILIEGVAAANEEDAPSNETRRGYRNNSTQSIVSDLVSTIRDPNVPRPLKMDTFFSLGTTPCTSIQGLIFGLDSETEEALEKARQDLARFPSEEEFFGLFAKTAEWGSWSWRPTAGVRVLYASAGFTDWVLGTKRIQGCMELLL